MTYNCKMHLTRTLRTILGQTWPEIEIVIADGGSTDGTLDVIRDLETQLQADTWGRFFWLTSESSSYQGSEPKEPSPLSHGNTRRTLRWISEPDHGLYDALNKTVAMATGDYLIVANDRLVKKDALEKLVQALESGDYAGAHADLVYTEDLRTAGDMCGTDAIPPDEDIEDAKKPASVQNASAAPVQNRTTQRIRRYWHMGNSHRLWNGWIPGHPALLLKREIYEQYGWYKTDYRIAADCEFIVRFLKDRENRLAYVPEVLISMYYGGTSTGHFSDYMESFREVYRSLRENGFSASYALFSTILRTVRVVLQFR